MSLPPELLKKVKLIELRTRKLVNNLMAGEYHTAFKGRGMIFSEFREYVPGDDVRAISWPATARTGKVHIKKFDEERELTMILAVDVSGSGDFGSGEMFKGEVVVYLAAILGFAAAKNNDQVGLLLFSDRIEHYVPPKKGRGHIQRLIRDLLYFKPKSRGTDIATGIDYLQGVMKKKSSIFIFSDFMDKDFERPLSRLAKKHDVVAVVVQDPVEKNIPKMGLVDFHDAESGEIITIDTSNKNFQLEYREHLRQRELERDNELRKSQVDKILVPSSANFIDPLVAFFRRRN